MWQNCSSNLHGAYTCSYSVKEQSPADSWICRTAHDIKAYKDFISDLHRGLLGVPAQFWPIHHRLAAAKASNNGHPPADVVLRRRCLDLGNASRGKIGEKWTQLLPVAVCSVTMCTAVVAPDASRATARSWRGEKKRGKFPSEGGVS
jgi:hypothetical protein